MALSFVTGVETPPTALLIVPPYLPVISWSVLDQSPCDIISSLHQAFFKFSPLSFIHSRTSTIYSCYPFHVSFSLWPPLSVMAGALVIGIFWVFPFFRDFSSDQLSIFQDYFFQRVTDTRRAESTKPFFFPLVMGSPSVKLCKHKTSIVSPSTPKCISWPHFHDSVTASLLVVCSIQTLFLFFTPLKITAVWKYFPISLLRTPPLNLPSNLIFLNAL